MKDPGQPKVDVQMSSPRLQDVAPARQIHDHCPAAYGVPALV